MAPSPVPEPIFESAIDLLVEICAISSASHETDGLWRVAERLADACAARGLPADLRHEGAERDLPLLVAGDAETPLLLVGHLDTVLPAAEPTRDPDRLQATGAYDMKGGLVAFLAALDVLRQRGVTPPSDLQLVCVPDEEVGGGVSELAMRSFGERARAILVLEPGSARDDGETVVLGRRGAFDWHLDVTGRAAHSGLAYFSGRSALLAAAEFCRRAAALSGPGAQPTINPARLRAGDRALNVVPDRAEAAGDARFLIASDGEDLRTTLEELARRVGDETETELAVRIDGFLPPVEPMGAGRAIAERAQRIAAEHGWALHIEEDRGGVSFPNFLRDPQRAPVLDGLGPVGAGMHTPDEYVDLRSLRRRIALLAELLLGI